MQPLQLEHAMRRTVVASLVLVAAGIAIAAHDSAQSGAAASPRGASRVLVLYDMEGASGVLTEAAMDPARPDSFALARATLASDVNAVVAGLFDGGATQVDVRNTHGAGGDTLVSRQRLDARARIITGQRPMSPYVLASPNPDQPGGWSAPTPQYDAVVTVAMHDKPMSGGFLPHTLSAGVSPIINGKAVTEVELIGFNFGTAGIPVIFASGDDRLRTTLADAMPWLEYVTVKRVITPMQAAPLAAADVQRTLHDGALRAIRGLGDPARMHVMRLPAEFQAGLLPSFPMWLPPGIGSIPGIQKHVDTVTFASRDYRSAFWAIFVLQRIASAYTHERSLLELGQTADSAVLRRTTDSVIARWREFETGKGRPR